MPQNTRRYFEELGELPDAKYDDVTIRRGRGPNSPEFGPIVKSKMGKPFEQLVTPELIAQSQHYGTPTSHRYEALGGVNYASWLPPETIPHMLEARLMELDPRGVQPGKRIFGIGSSASPDIWAHEYRHEDLRGDYNEWRNRIADTVFSATSFPAYRNAIRSFNEYRIISAGQGGDYQEVARLRKLYKDEPAMEASVLRELSSKSNLAALVRLAEKGGQPVSDFGRVGSRGNFIERNVNYNRRNVDVSKLSKDELKIRAYFPFLNFVGRIQGDQSMDDRLRQAFPAQQDPAPGLRGPPRAPVKKAGGGEVQAEPTESPLEAARRIYDSLISSPQRFEEGGEVKKEESPMASPVGGAKQMLAELESEDKKIAERKRPRSKESIEEERASKELDRGTLMSGSLVAPTIAREGDLTVRRFAGGGSADKGKLTLEPVGGVEFGPANPAPRSLKDFVPGAADLPRSPPQKAPGWSDPAAYNLQGLSYGLGTGLTNALEGLSSLPGTAMDLMRGFGQRVRELSPEHLRGSAPAADTTVYDAAQAALKRAAGNPVEAAKQVAGAAMDYVRQGVSSPQNMAQFIGENINPLPKVGPRAGPTMGIVKEKGGNWVSADPKALEKYRQHIRDHMADAERADLDEGDLEQERIVAEEDAGVWYDLYGAASTSPDLAISSLAARHSPDISNWLISKLGRYVKSEMGTKEDPLRALAEQGISHLGPEELNTLAFEVTDDWGMLLDAPQQFGLRDTPPRTVLGPDIPDEVHSQMVRPPLVGNPEQLAEVHNRYLMARNWETLSDYAIRGDTYQNQVTSSVRRPYRGRQSDGSSDYINPDTGVSWEIPTGWNQPPYQYTFPNGRPADYFNQPRPYERWAEEDNINPNDWIQQQLRAVGGEFAVKNPGAKAYSIRSQDVFRGLGFGHLADELEAALNNPEFPPQLRLTPKDLNALSVPDAVRRVHAINVWRENNKREPSLELANNPATVTVQQYPVPGDNSGLGEGYRWDSLELNKSMPRKEAQKYLQEALDYEGNVMAGCQGTFCDSIMNRGTQLFSLRDAVTGGPKVTIELKSGFALGQIKGFANKVPSEKYRPMILQFLNSRANDLSPSHAWSQGNDLARMGIIDAMEYGDRMRYASATPYQIAFSNIVSGLKAGAIPELLGDHTLEVAQDLARRASGSRRGGGGSGRLLINAPLPRFMTAEQLKQAALETLEVYKAKQTPKPPKPTRRPR